MVDFEKGEPHLLAMSNLTINAMTRAHGTRGGAYVLGLSLVD